MIVLGLESSCDETAAAVVTAEGTICQCCIVAGRRTCPFWRGRTRDCGPAPMSPKMDRLVAEAMKLANVGFSDLSAVAATAGPGLIGGVLVGLMTAKAIAAVTDKPLIGVNHLEGHALTVAYD